MTDKAEGVKPESVAERFRDLIEAERLAHESVRGCELLPPAELAGDARLDFLVRLRAAIGKPATGSRDAGFAVASKVGQVDAEIARLQSEGRFTPLDPRWRFADFADCVRVERDRWGQTQAVVFARDARTFAAGERLLAHLSARGCRLPTYGDAEYAVLVRTTGGDVDHLFSPRDVGFGAEYRFFDGEAVVRHTAAVRAEQDEREREERERREAAERTERERRENEVAQLLGKLSDPATAARVRVLLGV